jgi:hypothetical protein
MLFYIGVLMFFIGALGIGYSIGIGPSECGKISRWKFILIIFLLLMGFVFIMGSSFYINKGEPVTTFKVGKEYRVLDAYSQDNKIYLVVNDGDKVPHWYQVDQDQVDINNLYGRFSPIDTSTGQRFQFFH